MSGIRVGVMCVIERRFSHGTTVQAQYTKPIVRITLKRAYFDDGDWFALDDPRREVRPKYLDYIATATPTGDGGT